MEERDVIEKGVKRKLNEQEGNKGGLVIGVKLFFFFGGRCTLRILVINNRFFFLNSYDTCSVVWWNLQKARKIPRGQRWGIVGGCEESYKDVRFG